jgi:hydrogenase maturation protein HypF
MADEPGAGEKSRITGSGSMISNWSIRLQGQVQGVGFRPLIWNLATERQLKGWVSNGLEGLEIQLQASQTDAEALLQAILKNPPPGSRITSHVLENAAPTFFDNFSIRESSQAGQPTMLLTPDAALCEACRQDFLNPGLRRFGYAFVTCAQCGPRYSIQKSLPYDRERCSMVDFVQCPACRAEYEDPADRRFFAQTNSCPDCGVNMWFENAQGQLVTQSQAAVLTKTKNAWLRGQIVAIKGIGGYLLTCDARNTEAVNTLRTRKNRPNKPFALLYPNLTCLQRDTELSTEAIDLLQSPAAPIVLLSLKSELNSGLATEAVAPGLDKIGAMLPYAPLLELLMCNFPGPVVATSGNLSSAPIVFKNQDCGQLSEIADFFLHHDREIVVPQDDSVMSLTAASPIVLRRSRGLAPTLLVPNLDLPDQRLLALGAEMKGTFAFTYAQQLFVSQYWGNLDDFDTQTRYHAFLEHSLQLFKIQPEYILGDLHPGYFTTRLGQDLAAKWKVSFKQVQHHEAHFAAVLAENQLLDSPEPVLGVIWDGIGMGRDGQIWGGEFFLFAQNQINRLAHLPYFPWLLGDKMSKEPRLAALACCADFDLAKDLLKPKFQAREWDFYTKNLANQQGPKCSSMGRYFDAAASLLGLIDVNTYEGEAAVLLEVEARKWIKMGLSASQVPGFASPEVLQKLDHSWWGTFLEAIKKGQPKAQLAFRFHQTLVNMILAQARRFEVSKIACSGGVFQNTLLVELLQYTFMNEKPQIFFHQHLSPNDENIAFGQLIYSKLSG